MQLKIRRSQREGGLFSNTVIFCLDARVAFTLEEQQHLNRYKLYNEVIYNSEASKHYLAKAEAQLDGSIRGSLKSIVSVAMAAMKLNISIASLQRGQRVECKSLDELLGAEQAVMSACENLKLYLDTAATFDGREVLFDFATGEPIMVAQSAAPATLIATPPNAPVPLPALGPPAPAAIPPLAHSEEVPQPAASYAASYAPSGYGPGFWSILEHGQRRTIIIAAIAVLFLILVRCASR